MISYVVLYLVTFICLYVIYYLFVVRRKKTSDKIKNSLEVKYLISKYKIDIERINLKKLSNKIALCNSFIISTTFMVVLLVKHFILQMLLGFVVFFPLIIICYHILGKKLKKEEGK